MLRVALGALFFVSGYWKLLSPHANFLAAVESYSIVSGPAADAVAALVPWLEVLGGAFLAAGLGTRGALRTLWALITLFIFVLVSARIRGLELQDCGCFGDSAGFKLSPAQTLWLDAGLFLSFAALWRLPGRDAFSLDRLFEKPGRL
jgi:uncharacterized membrane protein YphA (DoxX/SURF4 family)